MSYPVGGIILGGVHQPEGQVNGLSGGAMLYLSHR